MHNNLSQIQTLSQKLSPQQIQFIKLLQIPTAELQARIQEELETNPALEDMSKDEFMESLAGDKQESGQEEDPYGEVNTETPAGDFEGNEEFGQDEYTDDAYDDYQPDELSLNDYMPDAEDMMGYKMEGDGGGQEEEKEMPIASSSSLSDALVSQLGYLGLDDEEYRIGLQLIGSIDDDGYIRRDIEAIVNDLAFYQGVSTNRKEVELMLKRIQQFDPPGIGARDLQECLHLQLMRKDQHDPSVLIAIKVVLLCFDEFTKKHYAKIAKKIDVSEEELKEAMDIILHLNPKPGESSSSYGQVQYLTPDFLLTEVNGKIIVTLNAKNAPDLRVSRQYIEMFDSYEKSKNKDKKIREALTFVKQKLDAAKWFIDAIKQRQETLLKTMRAIAKYQYDFFVTGDESKLRPMILKDIAQMIDMDISTVSRVANSKAVQTDFGLYPLKFFFSESIQKTDSDEEVSSKEVKYILRTLIQDEDKNKPLSDDRLEQLLKEKGYDIARRTVAKYREQLGIPVARLRKEL